MTTVLQIIPHLGAGGAEQACVDVTIGLKSAGHRALIMTSGGARLPEIRQAGGEIILRPVHRKNPWMIFINMLWMIYFIQHYKVDIVHVRSRAPAWSAWGAARLTRRSFVTTQHAAYKFSNPLKKLYNSVMAKGDRVIAISEFLARHITRTYTMDPSALRTIPRGIDLVRFSPENVDEKRRAMLCLDWKLELGKPLILVPSRISPIKGQALFLEAMAMLGPEFKQVHAIILGDDQGRHAYREELQSIIDKRELHDRVQLVHHCQDMPAAYSLASLVVAPSLVPEGFGRVPVEAMAMGVPVIASKLGGFTETIQHNETGWLVEPHDPEALAQAIMQALSLSDEQLEHLVLKARQQARARYDKWQMVAATLAVYEEVKKTS